MGAGGEAEEGGQGETRVGIDVVGQEEEVSEIEVFDRERHDGGVLLGLILRVGREALDLNYEEARQLQKVEALK